MNITHEILDVLSKETAPLCLNDLLGTLQSPTSYSWQRRVDGSLRVLVELDFLRRTNSLTHTYYEIAPQGTLWLKIAELPEVAVEARS